MNDSTSQEISASGLDGVVAAQTRLSDVDGQKGRLIIAGHDVERLAGQRSFEAVAALLLGSTEAELRGELGRGRLAAYQRLPGLSGALALDDGMDALRAAVAQLPDRTSATELIASVGVYAAAWVCRRDGRAPLAPNADRSHAADLLTLLRGLQPSADEIAAFESYLVTVSDHGMNASTFAARVVASTGSDRVSCIVAAIGALKGPLHGGAPGPVLDMLDAVGTVDQADAWVARELDAGRRIMGMGHRVYRVRDPRAAVLEAALRRLDGDGDGGENKRLALARAVEESAARQLALRHPGRALPANVEFYTALLLEGVGVPRSAFTLVFAASRVAGWCAHVAEQQAHGRLIRPASRYVGPVPA